MLTKLKAHLMRKWATDFGLTIVKIRIIDDTEYLVCHDGHMRKLAKREKK
jgi:hypothetical protein